jgi:hypothetical protein
MQARCLIVRSEGNIKMNYTHFKQWLLLKGGAVFVMAFSVVYIYFTVDYMGEYNTYSLIKRGDVIEYNGKVIICASGIPIVILVFFFSLRLLLKKGAGPLKRFTTLGLVWGGVSMLSITIGLIASFIIPFILMASPYTSCNMGKYSSYYVINPELCKTIVPDQWVNK